MSALPGGPCIRGVLLDWTGTLCEGSKAIPGAPEAMAKLHDRMTTLSLEKNQDGKQHQAPIRILTNTSTVNAATLYEDMLKMGFHSSYLRQDQIYTSVLAMRDFLLQHKLRPFCLLDDVSDFVGSIPLDPPHNAVVLGLAPSKFNYANLNSAFHILSRNPHNLLAMHRSCFIKERHNDHNHSSYGLGPGAFVAALEAATTSVVGESTTTVIGKPSRAFYQSAMWNSIPPQEVCMVGDDIYGDIEGAKLAGIGTTILVQTGKYRVGDEAKVTPTVVVASVVEAVEYILSDFAGADSEPNQG